MRVAVVVVGILTEQQHPDLRWRHQSQRVEDVLLWRKDGVRRALGGHECERSTNRCNVGPGGAVPATRRGAHACFGLIVDTVGGCVT